MNARHRRLKVEPLEDRRLLATLNSVAAGSVYPVHILVEDGPYLVYAGDGPLTLLNPPEVSVIGSAWTAFDGGSIVNPKWNKNRGIVEFDLSFVNLPSNARVTLGLADLGGKGTDGPNGPPPTPNIIDIYGYVGDGVVTTDDYDAPLYKAWQRKL